MSNDMDANISFFTIDDVGRGKEFDVIANVEVGEDLNEVINPHEVRASAQPVTPQSLLAVAGWWAQ
jgi:hypothetical protein